MGQQCLFLLWTKLWQNRRKEVYVGGGWLTLDFVTPESLEEGWLRILRLVYLPPCSHPGKCREEDKGH